MWLEIKAVITVVAILFTAIVISQIILLNTLLGFLLIMAMGLYAFGDIAYGMMVVKAHANKIIDRPPSGWITTTLFTITGGLDFVWAKKMPYGKREFTYNNEFASFIDRGDYPIHFPNGALGAVAHESCNENLNMYDVKYGEEIKKDLGTNEIEEIYSIIKNTEKKNVGTSK